MSTKNHLKRIIQILRDNYEDEIIESGDWFWNLKNWTINIVTDPDFESVRAYRAKGNVTQWGEYITLEMREKQWKELV